MEIKFLGMIFVLLGSFGIGIFYRIRYGNRLHNMQDCERALLILQGEMEYGHTPLMEACRAGDCDRVRKLLAAKPDLERATWVYHRTVWDYAARSKRSYEVMTLLLEHGGRAPKSLELLEQLCRQWLWANPEECDT